jgi:uncharacterized OB-fold protein
MTTSPTDRPGPTPPVPDADSAPHWEQLRRHRLSLQVCTACGRRRFPPTPGCPYCAHPDLRWEEVAGTGTVYSAITVHRAFDPAFAADVPYSIATVDLDGGGRMIARVEGAPVLDGRVRPVFVDHDEWTELRFVPEEAG